MDSEFEALAQDTIITEIIELLRANQMKFASAESCTGGLIAHLITRISGASDILDRGFITYSNQAKIDMLGVAPNIIQNHGAVSHECAAAMASGAHQNSLAYITISVTGIAGPSGGSKEKPVGTVYFGLAQNDMKTKSFKHHFTGDRNTVQTAAARQAFLILKEALSK